MSKKLMTFPSADSGSFNKILNYLYKHQIVDCSTNEYLDYFGLTTANDSTKRNKFQLAEYFGLVIEVTQNKFRLTASGYKYLKNPNKLISIVENMTLPYKRKAKYNYVKDYYFFKVLKEIIDKLKTNNSSISITGLETTFTRDLDTINGNSADEIIRLSNINKVDNNNRARDTLDYLLKIFKQNNLIEMKGGLISAK